MDLKTYSYSLCIAVHDFGGYLGASIPQNVPITLEREKIDPKMVFEL